MENAQPSIGYYTLARLLTETNQHNLVITTNFDSLTEDSLYLYTEKRPLVIGHESLVQYINLNIQRPIIAKVHRSLMYAPMNSSEDTAKIPTEWKNKLGDLLKIYTPIVIGYGGGDSSLMDLLQDDATSLKGIYWCYYTKDDTIDAKEIDHRLSELLKKRNGYLVQMSGFDALMQEIGICLYVMSPENGE